MCVNPKIAARVVGDLAFAIVFSKGPYNNPAQAERQSDAFFKWCLIAVDEASPIGIESNKPAPVRVSFGLPCL
jgi:hypothetical protein